VLTSSASNGNQWFFNNNVITGATAQSYSPTASGAYSVQVTLSGCSSLFSDSFPIVITGDIDEQPGMIQVYPNPVGEQLLIKGINHSSAEINASDLLGRFSKLSSWKIGDEFYVDVSDLSPGPYLLSIKEGNVIQKIRFVKQ
jgi:hypothetical protein